jgi:hypothetical protein
MKLLLILFLLFVKIGNSQEVKVQLIKDTTNPGNVFTLRVYNDTSVTIGIKCSGTFSDFSESSTLDLALGYWLAGNEKNIVYYGIYRSTDDAKYSDVSGYQLILLTPQTYFITKINLTDLKNFKKAEFNLLYTSVIAGQDLIKYSKRKPGAIYIFNEVIPFQQKILSIPH